MALPLFVPAVLLVFTASGFSGLIYESIWSHYLKLFLGHAAYAQSLVLAIFMGGMAGGAWLASRLSPRWRDLLLAYAVIEALIGVASLAFHDVFVAATGWAFDRAIPALGTPGAINGFKWTLAASLILPQAILLGMTFPLMTGGVLRIRPQRSGYTVAMLYFTNSLGAAVGVLASGFYFIPRVGLPGTLIAAGIINLCVAAAAMLLPRRGGTGRAPAGAGPTTRAPIDMARLLLAVAGLTGMSSFMYEIGWIRMLSLVLGSSTHAFELMLSAFILGIAFGGWWVRRRIDSAPDPVRLLGWVQLAMGAAALATLPVYGSSFRLMQETMTALSANESGYAMFNVISHGISLAVMFPAAFCAGMTLPLITASLLRLGAGERAIGQVYATNTAGAIVGVAVAVHLGFGLLGLKGLIIAGAAIDLLLGIVLVAASGSSRRAWATSAAGVAAVAALITGSGVQLDAHDMASGVYRLGRLLSEERDIIRFTQDGKTATVSVTESGGMRALRTNGKSDGSVRFGPSAPSSDEAMMTLLGALPQFLVPEARHVANIGFGTGITSHVLLASKRIERLDTVEIEPAMIAAGAHFRPFNARALDDERSRVHYEDAKTFFSSQQRRYDAILSEPSNPWVSGVAGLFSTEFYRDVRRYLKDGGLFFQWVQLYEMTPELLATIVGGLDAHFTDYELWLANHGDMIIVAAHNGQVPALDAAAFDNPLLRRELERFQIRNLDDLLLHRLAGRKAMGSYFSIFGAAANSDFFPTLDTKAPAARFMRKEANEVLALWGAGYPLLEMFDREGRQPRFDRMSSGERPWLGRAQHLQQADAAARYMIEGDELLLSRMPVALSSQLLLLRAALAECRVAASPQALRAALSNLGYLINSHAPGARTVWQLLQSSPCAASLQPVERDLLRLNAAIAARTPKAIVPPARALLDSVEALDRDVATFVLVAYMAAQLAEGQDRAAMRTFREAGRHISRSPADQAVFRFLVGHAEAGGSAP